jgi:DNA anti-recombination protein RmuC
MDTNFLEFWGRSLLNVASGQRQMDEFSRWLSGGLGGSDSLSALFRQTYGLDKVEKGGAEYLNLYEKAVQSFQQSFREYLRLFDVTPREEHESLMKECEALKQKVLEQEQTIGRLKKILGDKDLESAETVRDLQDVLKKQVDQFQEMMTTMGQAFQKKRPSKSK